MCNNTVSRNSFSHVPEIGDCSKWNVQPEERKLEWLVARLFREIQLE